jgi:hypothetical protein
MTTLFYVDAKGNQLGGFGDGALPPNGAVLVPAPPDGFHIWSGEKWLPPVPTQEAQESNRQAAYTQEADPLFFKWQAGEATEQEWVAKREEIRQRFPYPEE